MKTIVVIGIVLLATALLAVSCAQPAPAPAPAPKPAPTTAPAPAAAPASPHDQWAKEFAAWEKQTYEAAKAEGKVVWYASYPSAVIDPMNKAFAKRYPGLKLEQLSLRGEQIIAKVTTEQNSGQIVGDLAGTGLSALRPFAKDGRNADFIPPAGLEPGVQWLADPLGEQENFPGSKGIPILNVLRPYGLLINTKLVPPDKEPKGWKDLLDPWWKGKIIAQDPRTIGGGQNAYYYMREMYGEQFWANLAAQNVHFDASLVVLGRAVATGEYCVAVQASPDEVFTLKDAPIKLLYPTEGVYVSESSVSLVKGAPHPNTAKLFLNWLLTKEGQDIYGETSGKTPIRPGAKIESPLQDLKGRKVLRTTFQAAIELLPKVAQDVKKYIGK